MRETPAIDARFKDDLQYAIASRPAFRKNLLSVGLYCIAIPGAYLSPALSLAIIAAIVISYFLPNAWIE